MDIYKLKGNKLETLFEEKKPSGLHNIQWYASKYPSGIYLYRIQAGEFVQTNTMLFLK